MHELPKRKKGEREKHFFPGRRRNNYYKSIHYVPLNKLLKKEDIRTACPIKIAYFIYVILPCS